MERLPLRLVRAAVQAAQRKAVREQERAASVSSTPFVAAAQAQAPPREQVESRSNVPPPPATSNAADPPLPPSHPLPQLLHPSLAPETLLCVLSFLPLHGAASLGLVACAAREVGESHAAVWHALCHAALREHPFLARDGENEALVIGGAAGRVPGGWRALFHSRFCPATVQFRGAQLRAAQHELARLADRSLTSCRRSQMTFSDGAAGEQAEVTERVWYAFSTLNLKALLREDERAAVVRALAGRRADAAVLPGNRLQALVPVLYEYARARLERWREAGDDSNGKEEEEDEKEEKERKDERAEDEEEDREKKKGVGEEKGTEEAEDEEKAADKEEGKDKEDDEEVACRDDAKEGEGDAEEEASAELTALRKENETLAAILACEQSALRALVYQWEAHCTS